MKADDFVRLKSKKQNFLVICSIVGKLKKQILFFRCF